jgi:polysaccharide biosynthesis/export protein
MPGRLTILISSSTATRVHPWRRSVLGLCGLLLWTAGCASGPSGEIYTVDKLPHTMLAAQRDNAKTINLSGLSRGGANSDIIDKGDVLQVQIAAGLNEKDNVNLTVRVQEDGSADIPVVGPVPVVGLEMAAAEAEISKACIDRQLYRSPSVTVTMKHQRTNKVTVVGAVKSPGVKLIPRGSSDLLAALVAADGLAEDAGTNVEIRNPKKAPDGGMGLPPIASSDGTGVDAVGFSVAADPVSSRMESIKVDLVSATKPGSAGYQVYDGAVIMVEKRDPEPVHVLGLVRTPNRYEFPIGQDLRLLDALALAGGISNPVANRVYVVRKKPGSNETAIISMTVSQAKRNERSNLRLSPGDVVSVEQTPATVLIDALKLINFGLGGTVPLL